MNDTPPSLRQKIQSRIAKLEQDAVDLREWLIKLDLPGWKIPAFRSEIAFLKELLETLPDE